MPSHGEEHRHDGDALCGIIQSRDGNGGDVAELHGRGCGRGKGEAMDGDWLERESLEGSEALGGQSKTI